MSGDRLPFRATLVLSSLPLAALSAQHLTIRGRIVDTNDRPLYQIGVSLDSLKIPALTNEKGEYVMVVPDSVVHSQKQVLVAFARGRAMQRTIITLSGTEIVRNFVLPLGTTSPYASVERITQPLAAQLRIQGRVVDSAGAPIPGASIRIEGLDAGGGSESDGTYSFGVSPATGQRAKILVHQFEYAPISDSITLSGTVIRRDFVMREFVYSATAAQVLSSQREVAHAVGLGDLATAPRHSGEREIRIWMFGGMTTPDNLIRLVSRSGAVMGEHIRYWKGRDGWLSAAKSDSEAKFLRRICGDIRLGEVSSCRARYRKGTKWARLFAAMDSADIWHIPDEGPRRKHMTLVFDGESMVAETWDGRSYNAWSYNQGVKDDAPAQARVSSISSLLRKFFSQMVD